MDRIELILENTMASLAVENLNPSSEAVDITRKFLKGEISSEKAIKMIKKLHGVEV